MAGPDIPLLSTRRYDELAAGDAWGPFPQRLDAAACDRLRREPGVVVAGAEAPPGILPALCLWGLRRALDGIIPGGVLTRQYFRELAPAPRPGLFEVGVRVTEQQRGPRGLHTSFVFPISQDGVLIAIAEWTIRAAPEEQS